MASEARARRGGAAGARPPPARTRPAADSGVLEPEQELQLAELHGLEPRSGVEVVAKPEEVLGPHGLQDPDLVDEQVLDLHDAAQQARGLADPAGVQVGHRAVHLVEGELEPELVDLMDDDEERLVVMGRVREPFLQGEQLGDLQVLPVGERHLGILPPPRRHPRALTGAVLPRHVAGLRCGGRCVPAVIDCGVSGGEGGVAKASPQRKPPTEARGRKAARPQLALFDEGGGKVV
jgi:hypothetical protein